jgi:phosphoribosyl-AMP cyclohydrolase
LALTNPDLFPTAYGAPDALIFIKPRKDNIARKYPYTNTFFIGISEFSANLADDPNVEADWRPVAHELGHYLYWNSLFPTVIGKQFAENDRDPIFAEDLGAALENIAGVRASAQSMNEGLTTLMIAWSEEIFADLVGTRLLGREYAESAQELFIDQQKKQDTVRFSDDIEHPIPYLRPFVCAEGLKLVENKRNKFWSGFKTMIESLLNKPDFETSQRLSIGLFTTNTTIREEGYTTLELDIPTLQEAIKTVVPVIYDKITNKEVLTGRLAGIELIRSKIREDFVNFYINASDVWERGDKQGIMNKGRSIFKRIIRFLFR